MELHLENVTCETKAGDVSISSSFLYGEWDLPFTLDAVDEWSALTAEEALVPQDREGPPVSIKQIQVTSTGMKFIIEDGFIAKEYGMLRAPLVTPDIALQLSGGVEIKMDGFQGTWSGELENSPWEYRCEWVIPVDLGKVESVRFGDVVVPLNP